MLRNGNRYVDTANEANTNVFLQRAGSSGYLRVTLDPTGQRVISAGLNTARNVANGIASGRFTVVP